MRGVALAVECAREKTDISQKRRKGHTIKGGMYVGAKDATTAIQRIVGLFVGFVVAHQLCANVHIGLLRLLVATIGHFSDDVERAA